MVRRWKVERFSRENTAPWPTVGWWVHPLDTWDRTIEGDFDEWPAAIAYAFERVKLEAADHG